MSHKINYEALVIHCFEHEFDEPMLYQDMWAKREEISQVINKRIHEEYSHLPLDQWNCPELDEYCEDCIDDTVYRIDVKVQYTIKDTCQVNDITHNLTAEIEDLLCRKYGFDWKEDYIEVSWKYEK